MSILNDSGKPLVSAKRFNNSFKSLCRRSKYTAKKLLGEIAGFNGISACSGCCPMPDGVTVVAVVGLVTDAADAAKVFAA